MPGAFYVEGRDQKVSLKTLEDRLAEVLARIGDPDLDIIASLTGKWGDITRSLDLVLGDRWDGSGDLGTDVADMIAALALIQAQAGKLSGQMPVFGSVIADWQAAEADVVSIGSAGARNKLHSLLLSVHELVGTSVTVRMYLPVKGVERRVYAQTFDATTDPPGIWIVNGTVAIHEVLRVTLQSNDAADNGKAVDYDYMLEAM